MSRKREESEPDVESLHENSNYGSSLSLGEEGGPAERRLEALEGIRGRLLSSVEDLAARMAARDVRIARLCEENRRLRGLGSTPSPGTRVGGASRGSLQLCKELFGRLPGSGALVRDLFGALLADSPASAKGRAVIVLFEQALGGREPSSEARQAACLTRRLEELLREFSLVKSTCESHLRCIQDMEKSVSSLATNNSCL